jgi:hypothetical protein
MVNRDDVLLMVNRDGVLWIIIGSLPKKVKYDNKQRQHYDKPIWTE